jgi:Phosphotransferase enzyme family
MSGLPTVPEAITAEWLDHVLPAHDVEVVQLEHVLAGSTTKVFVRAGLADGSELPVCVKGVFDEPRLPVRVMAAQQEGLFFRELAPTLDIPLFRTWFADADEHQGVVVFDDLRGPGTTFTDVGAAWTKDRVAAALEVQAAWHAATWGFPADRYPWLASGNQILGAATDALFSQEHWDAHTSDPTTVTIPEPFTDRARMEAAERALFGLQAQSVHALSHGDAHIGNTYLDADGRTGFYDWQTFCLAPPLDDASYFIAGAMTVGDRRAHEQDLLRHYLSALAAAGAPAPGWDEAWQTYRTYQVHGFFWAVLPTSWQPVECSVPMAERYIAAMQDHDSLELLEGQ